MTRTLGLFVFLFFAFCVGSSGGSASPKEEVTRGNWLLGSCQLTVKSMDDPSLSENTLEAYRDGFCRGLIDGVSHASPKVCPNEEVTHGQETRVVLKYLQDHPEELHLVNAVLVDKALSKAFPCK